VEGVIERVVKVAVMGVMGDRVDVAIGVKRARLS
jgi:hypothetical protein